MKVSYSPLQIGSKTHRKTQNIKIYINSSCQSSTLYTFLEPVLNYSFKDIDYLLTQTSVIKTIF